MTFAATYRLDPRYTLVFAEQYDFDYGAGIQSDITLIRKYHRMNLALTVSADESLDEERVVSGKRLRWGFPRQPGSNGKTKMLRKS